MNKKSMAYRAISSFTIEVIMADDIILETRSLRREFGALVAVDNVSIQVKPRTLHSIIGPNGAGKTTFFNLLSGNLAPPVVR
ncbi:MAG: ATP-binding cassette domain-containing protein [Chloroflexota bacterium]